jgi:hypothetical protein
MKTKLKIKFVDGLKIRNSIDLDFVSTHTHSHSATGFAPKYYIPKGELWVDRKLKDETEFLIKMDSILDRLMKRRPYREARRILCERYVEKGPIPYFVKRSRKIKGGILLKYVDGGIVRRYIDPEFALGGHGYVYDYIPKNEIWIDAKIDRREYKYTILHESTERDLMIRGKNYDIAHDYATVKEKEARRLDGTRYPGDEPK